MAKTAAKPIGQHLQLQLTFFSTFQAYTHCLCVQWQHVLVCRSVAAHFKGNAAHFQSQKLIINFWLIRSCQIVSLHAYTNTSKLDNYILQRAQQLDHCLLLFGGFYSNYFYYCLLLFPRKAGRFKWHRRGFITDRELSGRWFSQLLLLLLFITVSRKVGSN